MLKNIIKNITQYHNTQKYLFLYLNIILSITSNAYFTMACFYNVEIG